MAVVDWTPSLSVGIADIDRQHKSLVEQINALNEAMKAGKGKEALGKVLSELISYTASHFATEEKLFDKYAYPDTAAHKKEHGQLVQKVTAFKADFDKGQTGLTVQVMNFLGDWLRTHIQGSDSKYAPFLQSKGVK